MPDAAPAPLDPEAIARWLALDPRDLLKACEQMPFQGPGPGGQKRNRVYSGVRLRHRESGLSAEASERREARRNLEDALRRLRMALALLPPPPPPPRPGPGSREDDPRDAGPDGRHGQGNTRDTHAGAPGAPPVPPADLPAGLSFRADAGPLHADFPRSVFLALLALETRGGRVSEAAASLGTGASALARLLRSDKAAWARAQAVRKAHGLPPLK